jgi:hypothetical protein
MPGEDLFGGHVQASTCGYDPRRLEIEKWAGDSVYVRTVDPADRRAEAQNTVSFSDS